MLRYQLAVTVFCTECDLKPLINTLIKSHNRTERDSQGVSRDILISKKLFLELADHAKTVSGKLVDFRKTRFHDFSAPRRGGVNK